MYLLGSLSTRVFGTRTATGREHFTCQDSSVSQIFVLIISNGEKTPSNVNVVVWKQVKRENSSLPVAVRVSKTCVLKLPIDWVGGPDGEITANGPSAMTEGQIFSRRALPDSVNKHFIIWPPRFSILFFFSGIGMFTYVAHFDRKVGIYIATKLFQFASRKEPYAIRSWQGRTAFSGPACAIAYGPHRGFSQ